MLFLKGKRVAFWTSLVFMIAFLGGLLFWLEKDVTIAVDGKLVKAISFKKTVAEVLEQKGIEVREKDLVEPGLKTRLEKGTHIKITRAFKVKVNADGQQEQILSPPTTVAQALKLAGVTLGQDDLVAPGLNTLTSPGKIIKVTRVTHRVITSRAVVPYPVQRTADNTLEKGLTKTLRRGQDGLAVQEVKIIYHDGKESSREVIARRMVKDPVPRVIAMGTITSVSRGSLRLNFRQAMMAQATAYTYTGNRTASGRNPAVGLVAVDTGVIPMGTRLYIEGYGFAQAADRGRDIVGNRVDLFMESEAQCLRWGRRNVKVYMLD